MGTNWKWVRVHEDVYDQLMELGEFSDSFNDIITRLIVNQGRAQQQEGPTAMGRDEIKSRLKKFDSHTNAISKLVKWPKSENITYSVTD